jgi:hypothetical protein
MTNVIDFTAYRAANEQKASTGQVYQNNVVSIAGWKDAAHDRRNLHVTTDVLASIGTAC